MKLTGWYRIGIVLSVLWCFLITGVVIYEYNHPTQYGSFVTLKPDITKPLTPPSPPHVYKEDEKWMKLVDDAFYQTKYEMKTVVDYRYIFSSMIIPLVMGWILVLTIVWTIKWIVKGFKSRPSKP